MGAVDEGKVLPKAGDRVRSGGEKDAGTSRASSGHKAPCYCHKDAIQSTLGRAALLPEKLQLQLSHAALLVRVNSCETSMGQVSSASCVLEFAAVRIFFSLLASVSHMSTVSHGAGVPSSWRSGHSSHSPPCFLMS